MRKNERLAASETLRYISALLRRLADDRDARPGAYIHADTRLLFELDGMDAEIRHWAERIRGGVPWDAEEE